MRLITYIVILSGILSSMAFAGSPGTIGPELTFRMPESDPKYWMQKDGLSLEAAKDKATELNQLEGAGKKWIKQYIEKLKQKFPGAVEITSDEFDSQTIIKIKQLGSNKELFELKVAQDQAVIEIGFNEKFKPQGYTLDDIKGFKTELQKSTFDAMAEVGLKPDVAQRIGGGHLNLGLDSTFGNDSTLFRNFLVDYANHPELAVGFGYRKTQAPTQLDWNDTQRKAFAELIKDFDASSPKWSIEKLATELEARVYKPSGRPNPFKYQAVCVKTVGGACVRSEKRVEIRAQGPQKSVDELISQGELYQGRIAKLKKDGTLVEYKPLTSMTTEEMATSFLEYVKGAGLDVKEYSGMIREKKLYDVLQSIMMNKCKI